MPTEVPKSHAWFAKVGLIKVAGALQLKVYIQDIPNVVRWRAVMFVNDLAVSAIMSGVIEVHVIAYSVAASAVL